MIRWIRPNLGTAPFDSINRDDVFVLDARHLLDKSGNTVATIANLLTRGCDALKGGKKVVVACDFGISRSNAIAAGVLSLTAQMPYREALQDVAEKTGEMDIKVEMALAVARALEGECSAGAGTGILVTGGTGFLGRALVESFGNDGGIFAPERSQIDLASSAVSLLNYCRDNAVGQIVHFAFPRVYTNPSATGDSLNMLRNVLEVCKHTGARLIFVSCHVVFDGLSGDQLLGEEVALAPRGIFGDMKYLEEMLVETHVRRGEVSRATCRFTPVYGPGGKRPRLLQTFYQAAKAGHPIRTHLYRNGMPKLDLLYVDDAVRAIRSMLDYGGEPDVFHFGTGHLHSTREIAADICQVAGLPFVHEEIEVDDLAANIAFASGKAEQLLGWKPRTRLSDGLAACLKSFGQ